MLKSKKILVGVSGSIAAYKTAVLVRLLVQEGVEVKVVMTKASTSFITPLTLATLSQHEVVTDFEQQEGGLWNNHVELGLWADLFLIAPASANTIGKMAQGLCDNLLLATYLSARCEVVLAPAMDLDMYRHPAVQSNLEQLASFGNKIIAPQDGPLASGLSGKGRMTEPSDIVDWCTSYFSEHA